MNREIRFRAWWVNDNKMESWEEIISYQTELAMRVYFNPNEEYPMILMQFTGLKDKNGKKIYEGDIVRTEVYRDERYGDFDEEVIFAGAAFYPVSMQPGITYEVIGNIYENPELLKQ